MQIILTVLLASAFVLAEIDGKTAGDATAEAAAAFDIEAESKGKCKCPSGYTLIYDPDAVVPATCQRIRFSRRVSCDKNKDHHRRGDDNCHENVIGACVKRQAFLRPYCTIPPYLQHACRASCNGRWNAEGKSCGAIAFLHGQDPVCLKSLKPGCDNHGVCPYDYDAACYEVHSLGCRKDDVMVRIDARCEDILNEDGSTCGSK